MWRTKSVVVVLTLAVAMAVAMAAVRSTQADTRKAGPAIVELELLLAIDVSSSVSDDEYALQTHGLAAAFRDAAVKAAIRRQGRLGIAVAVVQWGGHGEQTIAIDWVRLSEFPDIDTFAERIARMPRQFVGRDTRIGSSVFYASALLAENGIESQRQVIDISADGGVERLGIARSARDQAVAHGVTVNGLAIENEVHELEHFFRENVIGGRDAFVIQATGYDDFARAMHRKLIREIDNRRLALLVP